MPACARLSLPGSSPFQCSPLGLARSCCSAQSALCSLPVISNNFPLVIRLGANTIPSPQGKIKKSTTTSICRFVCPSEIFLRALPTPPKGAFAAAQLLLFLILHHSPLRLDLGLGTWTWTWTWTRTWNLDGASAICVLRTATVTATATASDRDRDSDRPTSTVHWELPAATGLPCPALRVRTAPHCTALHCALRRRLRTTHCPPVPGLRLKKVPSFSLSPPSPCRYHAQPFTAPKPG